MACVFVLCLCLLHLRGVFGVDEKLVTEGDSVTLRTDVPKIQKDEDILWKYGSENSLIAQIRREKQIFPVERIRDRLKLDHQTGSLTIRNIRSTDAGRYELKISGERRLSKTFRVSVYARLPDPVISRNSSQCSSSSCSVVCSVVNVSHVTLCWLKGNSLFSSISLSDLSISLSLPLEVDDQEKNTYSCEIRNPIRRQTTHLDISDLCHCEDRILLYILLIVFAGSLIIIGVMLCYLGKKCRRKGREGILYMNSTQIMSVTVADSRFSR